MDSRSFRRRVLLVAPQPFYEDRGTPIAVSHVVTSLSQLGWHVDVLTYSVGEDLHLPRVRIFRFGGWLGFKAIPIGLSLKKVLLDFFLPGAIVRRLWAEKYDCIHAVEEAVYPSLLLGRLFKVPVIYDMQSSIAEQLSLHPIVGFFRPGRLVGWLEKKAYTRADSVVCSAGLAQKFLTEPRATVACEWVFPGRYRERTETDAARIRQELGIPKKHKVIAYAGNFERNQGISLLIEAVPMILQRYSAMTLIMIGASTNELRKLNTTYVGLISTGHLILLPRLTRLRVREYLCIAEVAVSPRIDGCNMPLKVFDYLAAGLPVVATDITAHQSLAGKGLELVSPTSQGVADGIASVLENPRAAKSLRRQARRVAETELGWSRFCDQVIKIYEPVLTTPEETLVGKPQPLTNIDRRQSGEHAK
jgi:glycosyltransferase involved in cell wall biosynthesis